MGPAPKLAAVAVAIGLTIGGAALGWRTWIPAEGAVVGLRIGGTSLTPGEDIRQHVERRARALVQRRLALTLGSTTLTRSLGELGLRVDVAEVTRRARAIGRDGAWATRLSELSRARRGEIDVPLTFSIDPNALGRVLLPLKERSDTFGTAARWDFERDRVVPDRPGRYLDFDESREALLRAVRRGERTVTLPVREIAPEVNDDLVRKADLHAVVASYETHFARGGDAGNRATNIEVAAKKLDGVILAPGAVISFNRVVGARSKDNGFRPGWEIYKGEMVRGIGGGTCQVSSTLHAAAFFAGLDVIERAPHSRPSAYIGLGLDSTVSWPTLDLKLRNGWPFPIAIHTEVRGGTLTVSLMGANKPAKVEFFRDTLAVIPFKRKITESSWLPEGTIIKKQKGIRGYRIRRTRTIVPAAGPARVETSIDVYPSTPEHYVVPPGTDVDTELPPEPGSVATTAAVIESQSRFEP